MSRPACSTCRHWTRKGKPLGARLCREPSHLHNSVADKESGREHCVLTGPAYSCGYYEPLESTGEAVTRTEPCISCSHDVLAARGTCKAGHEKGHRRGCDSHSPGEPVYMSADDKTRLYPHRLPDGRVIVGHETPWPQPAKSAGKPQNAVRKSDPSPCHDPTNDACPWNDPETALHPMTRGLPCTCPAEAVKAGEAQSDEPTEEEHGDG